MTGSGGIATIIGNYLFCGTILFAVDKLAGPNAGCPMTNAEPSPTAAESPPKKHGCFFYGCITSPILLLLLAVGIFFGTRYRPPSRQPDCRPIYRHQTHAAARGGTAAGRNEGLENRVAAFSRALDAHTNAEPLILTGPQVNALIATQPELAAYKGKLCCQV